MKSSLEKLAGDAFWILLGQIVSAIAILANIRCLSEYLSGESMGQLLLGTALASSLSSIFITPLAQASSVHYPRNPIATIFATRKVAFLATQFSLFLLILICFPLCILGVIHWIAIGILSLIVIFESERYLYTSFLIAERKHKLVALFCVTDAWLRLLFSLFFVAILFNSAYFGMLGSLVGGSVALMIFRRLSPLALDNLTDTDISREMQSKIFRLAIPLVPTAFSSNVLEIGARYIVGFQCGFSDAGYYSIAYSLVKRPFGMFHSVTEWTMRPVVSNFAAQSSSRRFGHLEILWILLGATGCGVGVFLFYFFRNEIAWLLVSKEFFEVRLLLGWISLGIAFSNLASIFNSIFLIYTGPWSAVASNFTSAVACVVFTSFLSSRYGLQGAAMAVPCYFGLQLVIAILSHLYVRLPGIRRKCVKKL